MKQIFLFLVLGLCTISISAQTGSAKINKADRIIKKLDQRLNLSATQKNEIKDAYTQLSEGLPTRSNPAKGEMAKFKASLIARIEPMMTTAQAADFAKFKIRFLGQ